MRTMAVFALVASLALASVARAEDAPPPTSTFRLTTGFEALVVSESEMWFMRKSFRLAPEFDAGRWTFAPSFSVVETAVDLHGKDGLPLDMSFTFPWQPVIGARVEHRTVQTGRFELTLRAEYESPLARNDARIDSFTPRDALTELDVDFGALRDRVRLRQDWRMARVSAVLQYDLGFFRPWVQLGYLLLMSSVAVEPDERLRATLDSINVHPARFYADGAATPYYLAGLDFPLGGGYALRYYGAILPGKRAYATAGGALIVPLDFLAE